MSIKLFNELEYYTRYKYSDNEIPINKYLLPSDRDEVQSGIDSGRYPTLCNLARLQRANGEAPRSPDAQPPPPPFPPRRTKEELFRAEEFAEKDEFAKSVTPGPSDNWQQVGEQLFKLCRSNLDRVRAAFCYACTVRQLTGDAEETAAYRATRLGDHVEMFENLLITGKVPYERIRGYKKGSDYEPGLRAQNHGIWFACYVSGEWRFVDPHWGAEGVLNFDAGTYGTILDNGQIEKPSRKEGHHVSHYHEHWFLTDPNKLILTHCPVSGLHEWQMLPKCLTVDDFEMMPQYFSGCEYEMQNYQVDPVNKPWNVIPSVPGPVEIFLKEQGGTALSYSTSLKIHKKDICNESVVAILKACQHGPCISKPIRVSRDSIKFIFNPPCAGQFLLDVKIIGKSALSLSANSPSDETASTNCSLIAYTVHCPQTWESNEAVSTFPEGKLDGYGSGRLLKEAELESDSPAELQALDGEAELQVKPLGNMWPKNLTCSALGPDNQPCGSVLEWRDNLQVTFRFLAPDSGYYILVLYVSGKPVSQFLVDASSEAADYGTFPMPDWQRVGRLGYSMETERIDGDLRLIPRSHPTPYVITKESELKLHFGLETTISGKNIDIIAKLFVVQQDGREKEEGNFTLVNTVSDGYDVRIRLPRAGHYLLRILTRQSGTENLRTYFTYFVRCLGMLEDLVDEFPVFMSGWGSNCELIEPSNRTLPAGQSTPLRIRVDCMDLLSVTAVNIQSGLRMPLSRDQNDASLWIGSISDPVSIEEESDKDTPDNDIIVIGTTEKGSEMELVQFKQFNLKSKIGLHLKRTIITETETQVEHRRLVEKNRIMKQEMRRMRMFGFSSSLKIKKKLEVAEEVAAAATASAETKRVSRVKAEASTKLTVEAEASAKAELNSKSIARTKAEAVAKAKANDAEKAAIEANAAVEAKDDSEAAISAMANANTSEEVQRLEQTRVSAENTIKTRTDALALIKIEISSLTIKLADAKAAAAVNKKFDCCFALADEEAKAEAELVALENARAEARAKEDFELAAKAKAFAEAEAKAEADEHAAAKRKEEARALTKAQATAEAAEKAEHDAKTLAEAARNAAEIEALLKANIKALPTVKAESAAKATKELENAEGIRAEFDDIARVKAQAEVAAKVKEDEMSRARAAAEAEFSAREEEEAAANARLKEAVRAKAEALKALNAARQAETESRRSAEEAAVAARKASSNAIEKAALEAAARVKAKSEQEAKLRTDADVAALAKAAAEASEKAKTDADAAEKARDNAKIKADEANKAKEEAAQAKHDRQSAEKAASDRVSPMEKAKLEALAAEKARIEAEALVKSKSEIYAQAGAMALEVKTARLKADAVVTSVKRELEIAKVKAKEEETALANARAEMTRCSKQEAELIKRARQESELAAKAKIEAEEKAKVAALALAKAKQLSEAAQEARNEALAMVKLEQEAAETATQAAQTASKAKFEMAVSIEAESIAVEKAKLAAATVTKTRSKAKTEEETTAKMLSTIQSTASKFVAESERETELFSTKTVTRTSTQDEAWIREESHIDAMFKEKWKLMEREKQGIISSGRGVSLELLLSQLDAALLAKDVMSLYRTITIVESLEVEFDSKNSMKLEMAKLNLMALVFFKCMQDVLAKRSNRSLSLRALVKKIENDKQQLSSQYKTAFDEVLQLGATEIERDKRLTLMPKHRVDKKEPVLISGPKPQISNPPVVKTPSPPGPNSPSNPNPNPSGSNRPSDPNPNPPSGPNPDSPGPNLDPPSSNPPGPNPPSDLTPNPSGPNPPSALTRNPPDPNSPSDLTSNPPSGPNPPSDLTPNPPSPNPPSGLNPNRPSGPSPNPPSGLNPNRSSGPSPNPPGLNPPSGPNLKQLMAMLNDALSKNKLIGIQKAIDDIKPYESHLRGYDAKILFNAKLKLKALLYKKSLKDAIRDAKSTGNTSNLRAVVAQSDRDDELQAEAQKEIFKAKLQQAWTLIERDEYLLRIPVHKLDMNASSLQELRQYSKPVETVIETVQALLLLLGHCEKQTRKWSRCQSLLTDVLRKVHDFKPAFVDQRIAARSQQMLGKINKAEIALHSAAAFAFYEWATKTTQSLEEAWKKMSQPRAVLPATEKQQKRILQVSDEQEAVWDFEDKGIKGVRR